MKIQLKQDREKIVEKELPTVQEQLDAIWSLLPANVRLANPVFQRVDAVHRKYPRKPS